MPACPRQQDGVPRTGHISLQLWHTAFLNLKSKGGKNIAKVACHTHWWHQTHTLAQPGCNAPFKRHIHTRYSTCVACAVVPQRRCRYGKRSLTASHIVCSHTLPNQPQPKVLSHLSFITLCCCCRLHNRHQQDTFGSNSELTSYQWTHT